MGKRATDTTGEIRGDWISIGRGSPTGTTEPAKVLVRHLVTNEIAERSYSSWVKSVTPVSYLFEYTVINLDSNIVVNYGLNEKQRAFTGYLPKDRVIVVERERLQPGTIVYRQNA